MLDNISMEFERSHYAEMMAEMLGDAADGATAGMVAGTKVATSVGWQFIENVAVGDAVLTFDAGLRTVRAIRRVPLWAGLGRCPMQFRPMHIPADVIGNREAMTVLPGQGVLLESDVAEAETGDPFVLVAAGSLVGVCGIERFEPQSIPEVFVLQFDEDQIVFTASGALCICPAAGDFVERAVSDTADREYHVLSEEMDAALVAEIRWELEENWIRNNSARSEGGTARAALAVVS